MIRLSWTQPEDLLPHGIVAARLDGCDVDDHRASAGSRPGRRRPRRSRGASPDAGAADAARARPASCSPSSTHGRFPTDLAARRAGRPRPQSRISTGGIRVTTDAGPLVEISHGSRARRVARPRRRLPAGQAGREDPARRHPSDRRVHRQLADRRVLHRRRARPRRRRARTRGTAAARSTSLVENIDGMPEDDDLNFPLIALDLVERHGEAITTDDVAAVLARRAARPAGCSPPSGSTYRNLLDGDEPAVAGRVAQPVPGLDRRPDPHRRLRLGLPRRSGRARHGWPGRTRGSATPQRPVRRDVRRRGVLRRRSPERPSTSASTPAWRWSRRTAATPPPSGAASSSASGRIARRRASTRSTTSSATCTGCTCSTTRRCVAFALARGDGDFATGDHHRGRRRLGHRLQRRHRRLDRRRAHRRRGAAGRLDRPAPQPVRHQPAGIRRDRLRPNWPTARHRRGAPADR